MAVTTTSDAIGNLIKEMWTEEDVYEALIEDDSFMGIIEKDWHAVGSPIKMAIEFAGDGGVSSVFADAQTYHNSSGDEDWQLSLYDVYGVFQIANKTIFSMRDEGALIDALEHITSKKLKKFVRSMRLDLWRTSDGNRGIIESGSGSQSLVLSRMEDVLHFEQGDYIVSSPNLTGTTDDGEAIRIAGVNPITRTLIKGTAGNWNANGNFAANDYVFHVGTKGRKIHGVPDWLPSSAPSATLFAGVDRTQSQALYGVIFTADAAVDGNMPNALRRMASTIQMFGGEPTDCFLSPLDWDQCARQMGNPQPQIVNAIDPKGNKIAHIGYNVLILQTAKGPVMLHSTVHLRRGITYMLDRKTWKIVGNREPGLDSKDGNKILRMGSSAAQEGRFEAYWELGCKCPGHNGVGDLTAVTIAP